MQLATGGGRPGTFQRPEQRNRLPYPAEVLRSRYLAAMSQRGGIDLGGTKIQAVAVGDDHGVLGESGHENPTTGGPEDPARPMGRNPTGAGPAPGGRAGAGAGGGGGPPRPPD